ncbi:MAG: alkaline phosphatase family protein [Planctomycetota bacterium]|jgi:predicted AlkP superfamily pyrophosphatase or phosphodiesterase
MHIRYLWAVTVVATFMPFTATAQTPVNKSLVIGLDGVRSDGLITANTPYIDSLINGTFGGGSYSGAWAYYAQTDQTAVPASGPQHVSIMTGVTSTKHGVTDRHTELGNYAQYPHYITTLESNNSSLNTAYLVTWLNDTYIPSGADYIKQSTDADNTTRAVGIINGTFSDPSGNDGTSWASGTDPDAIFLFLDEPDGAGHGYGFSPAVAEYRSAIQQADTRVGQIFTAIENRPNFADENWQIVVISDHGGVGSGGYAHSTYTPDCETIPIVVASKSVQQGQLSGTPSDYDTAATAVTHMLGAGGVPSNYDGQARGSSVQPTASSLTEGLVVHLALEGDYSDTSGRGNNASVGPNSDYNPTLHATGGKFGGYVEINDHGGGASASSYLTLGKPSDLDFGTATSSTITMWYRVQGNQTGDPVIIGNKNWASGYNTGTLLLANESDGDDFGLNVADSSGSKRRDVEPIDYTLNEWWFLAGTFDRTGSVTLYAGSPDGTLWVLSDFLSDLGSIDSVLPWSIGQDGTGAYPHNLDADIDDLAIWQRTLSLNELKYLYNSGGGNPVPEPATTILLIGGAVAILAKRKRRS